MMNQTKDRHFVASNVLQDEARSMLIDAKNKLHNICMSLWNSQLDHEELLKLCAEVGDTVAIVEVANTRLEEAVRQSRKSPGQVAYERYLASFGGHAGNDPWIMLRSETREAWEQGVKAAAHFMNDSGMLPKDNQ